MRRRHVLVAAASLVVASTLLGISPSPAAAKGEPAPYAKPGPYAAGVTTLDMGGTPVEVWYPIARASIGDTPEDVYFIRSSLPAVVQAIIPPDVNPPFTQQAFRDLPPSRKGPFPLVLFSHGFAGIRLQSTFLTTHLAQWGFVVASPEFETRNLASVLGAKPANPQTDTQVLAATTRLVRAESARAGSVLEGTVKAGKVAVTGHSAGGFAAIRFGGRPDVATYIPLSAGGEGDRCRAISPPDTPSLYALGGDDDVVGSSGVERYWRRRVPAPKRLVVIGGAGHTSPTDLCDIGNGGLVQTAIDAGVPIPASFGDLYDCVKPVAPHDTWPVYDHFVTAQLRWAFGIDRRPVGLNRRAARSFLPVEVTYRQVTG
jgi:dienelactone hydrolase